MTRPQGRPRTVDGVRVVGVRMSLADLAALARMVPDRGATMSAVIRALIAEASASEQQTARLRPGTQKGRQMWRQGDVMIVATNEGIPDTAIEVPREDGRVVLAHGEATGHAHAFGERHVAMFRAGDDGASTAAYLRIEGLPATLRHEEHAPIEVPAGTYRVIRQREYTPAGLRVVAD